MGRCVHRDRDVGVLPQKFVAGDVGVRDRAFVHHDLRELFQVLEQPRAVGRIDAEAVEVDVDFEMRRHGVAQEPRISMTSNHGRPLVLKLL